MTNQKPNDGYRAGVKDELDNKPYSAKIALCGSDYCQDYTAGRAFVKRLRRK